jgi:hypothetical protein
MQIMTLSRGIRRGAGGFPRAVAHVAAAVLAVTAILAAVWAGPLTAASAGTRPRGLPVSAPAPVKFYIVPPPGNGSADSLFTIAAETLGDGSEYMEIFNLNKGRLQPNGGRLTNPQLIEPGWILWLPADAAGPGVRFGPLPVVIAPASPRPSRAAGTGSAMMISGALLAFLTAGLTFGLISRPAGPARRRRPAYARPPDGAGRTSRRGLQHDHDRYRAARSAPAPPMRVLARSGAPPAGWEPPAAPATGIQRWAAPLGAALMLARGHRRRPGNRRRGTHARPRRSQAHTQASSTVTKVSADLGGVAVDGTANLVRSAPTAAKPVTRPAVQPIARLASKPATEPEARPAARSATKSGTRPKSRPAGKPETRPAAKPTTRSAPKGRPRQLVAIRVATVATAALVLFALIAGTTEVALHGFRFFVFRSAGTGETGPNGLQEDQGPGQPDAPSPAPSRINVQPSPNSTVTAHNGQ